MLKSEHQHVLSGFCFVFDEKLSGIRRWTDGRTWSNSYTPEPHVNMYLEMDDTGESELVNGKTKYTFADEQSSLRLVCYSGPQVPLKSESKFIPDENISDKTFNEMYAEWQESAGIGSSNSSTAETSSNGQPMSQMIFFGPNNELSAPDRSNQAPNNFTFYSVPENFVERQRSTSDPHFQPRALTQQSTDVRFNRFVPNGEYKRRQTWHDHNPTSLFATEAFRRRDSYSENHQVSVYCAVLSSYSVQILISDLPSTAKQLLRFRSFREKSLANMASMVNKQ